LVYFEQFATPNEAIERAKELKSWRRELKTNLIESVNPAWDDLSEGWSDRFEGT
jgi:putative endonuclease